MVVESALGDADLHALKTYGYDYVKQAAILDPVIGRDEEIRNMITILHQKTKNNPLLIGEPGVGKTAIVKGLAQRIACGAIPDNLINARVIALDTRALVAGPKYEGEIEERFKLVLEEAEVSQGNVILFIDEIHILVRSMDATKFVLETRGVRCIGCTTFKELRKYEGAFKGCFVRVLVGEPSVHATVNILRGLKKKYEAHHDVRILDGALVGAAQLSSVYMTGFLPDKAIDLLDETCVEVRVQLDCQPEAIDNLERKRIQLELEFRSLKNEKGKASKARVDEVRKELANLKDELHPILMKYRREKEKQEEVLVTLQDVEKICNVTRVANMKFGTRHLVE